RWPGNVRELENCMESAAVLTDGEILAEHLPLPLMDRISPTPAPLGPGKGLPGMPVAVPISADNLPAELLSLAEVERRHILRVLDACKGNRTAAARALQIGRNTLARKLKE